MHEGLSHKGAALTASPRFLLLRDVIFAFSSVCLRHPKDEEVFKMNQTTIGSYIAQKRRAKNFTQEQLAEKLGVSNKTISKWENGVSHS